MSGDLRSDGRGQLALMDAMVFFSIAVVTSSVVLSYDEVRTDDLAGADSIDPENILRVFLRACVGVDTTLYDGTEVDGKECAADCLMAEAMRIVDGVDPGLFTELNGALLASLERVVAAGFAPHLSVVSHVGGTLIDIGRATAGVEDLLAASEEFPDVGGSRCLVVLVLVPSLGLEHVDV